MALEGQVRLFNRDVASCLNFLHILTSLRRNGQVPKRFTRGANKDNQATTDADSKSKQLRCG
jgi:hypothetical protein